MILIIVWILVAGFPNAADGFANWDVIWMESLVDGADFFADLAFLIHIADRFGHVVGRAVTAAIATGVAVNIDTDAIAKMFAGGACERFGFCFGGVIGVTEQFATDRFVIFEAEVDVEAWGVWSLGCEP